MTEYTKPDIRLCEDGKPWKRFERYYQNAVRDIVVPHDLDARGITDINSQIDEVFTEARFDYAFAKSKYDHFERKYMLAQKQGSLTFRAYDPKSPKLTAEDRKALMMTHLDTHPLPGMKEPITTLIDRWEQRKTFMDAVIATLKSKQEMMITGNGALKLEAQGRGDVGRGRDRDD